MLGWFHGCAGRRAGLALLLALPGLAAAQAAYKLTELLVGPKFDITLYSEGKAINKSGQTAIEYGYTLAGFSAARCTKGRCQLVPALQVPGFSATTPGGINEAGHVTGASFSGLTTHAFLFDGTRTIDLGGLPEDGCGGCLLDSIGRDLNNTGDVVGLAYTVTGAARAFRHREGAMVSLGTLGGDFSDARAVNDKGDIVGVATLGGGAQRAFVYRNGLMSDLGTLGGSHSAAFGVNEARQIVGCSTVDGDSRQSAFIHQQGTMSALPSLGGNDGCAYGINRSGQAVGYSTTPGAFDTRAVLWTGAGIVDLNTRLDPKVASQWVLSEARAINDKGQIVATGLHKGVTRAALLTPAAGAAPP